MENQNTQSTNEVAVNTGVQQEVMLMSPDGNSMIVKGADGKFKRKAIYKAWSSVVPKTKEEKLKMFELLESDDIAHPMGDNVGKKIEIIDVIFNPYDAVDEDTGELQPGVLTYLIDKSGEVYVTSSKSVYYTLQNAFKAFGFPHYVDGDELTVEIVKKQGEKFKYTDVKVIG